MTRKKETNIGEVGQRKPFEMDEIGTQPPVEKVAETDFEHAAALEAFMNEYVTIIVAPSTEEGQLEIITPNVNGMNQPIIRGVECRVKRKYVEDLARTRTTKYDQQVQDPTRPENIQMVERSAVTYPFTVTQDDNPKGREWLQSIANQPA